MADLDDDAITVTLPADESTATIVKVEGDSAKTATTADDPIADLKGQFANMTQRATSAEQAHQQTARELESTQRELQSSRTAVAASQMDTVLTGLQAAKAEGDSAEKEYLQAFEAGDGAAMARAQRKIAAAEGRRLRLEEAEGDLKDQTTAPKTETRPQPRQHAQDPVESAASTMAPRAAAWIRSHPDYINDRAKNSKMLATHYAALADGVVEGSDDYFAKLDAMAAGASPVTKKEEAPIVRRPSAPTAPGGNAGGGMNGGGMTVTLSKREAEAAVDGTHTWERDSPDGKFKRGTPLGVQEFARRKAILTKQGAYDRTFTES